MTANVFSKAKITKLIKSQTTLSKKQIHSSQSLFSFLIENIFYFKNLFKSFKEREWFLKNVDVFWIEGIQ